MPATSPQTQARRFFANSPASANEMRNAFEADGYLLIEGFVPEALCDQLRSRAMELVDEFDAEEHRTIFSAATAEHASSTYFQESGGAIRFFFEERAFAEDGRLRQEKRLSINKIGHALHDLDPVFSSFSRSAGIRSLVAGLPMAHPLLLQSMYIFKQPRIGGEVGWHVDSTYLYTDPLSCIGLWFALEDATLDNGAMCCMPGAHRDPLRSRFVKRNGRLETIFLSESPWPNDPVVALEARKGTLVVLDGRLPHRSGANFSEHSRHAYTLHLIDGAAHYPDDNWLQRRDDFPIRGF
jgi:phytanoyl-CoA hydroxylase